MRSIVLIASLVFSLVGGCMPCSQLLQQLSSVKSCCTKSGSCKIPKQPVKQNCSLTISASEHVIVPDAPQVAPPLDAEVFESNLVMLQAVAIPFSLRPQYSPPDLFLLNSAILI